MAITLTQVSPDAVAALVPLLRDADEGDARILATLTDPAHTSYLVQADGHEVGAATLRWQQAESEIIYIAVAAALRGQGVGKTIIAALSDEAQRRHIAALAVGTANSSLANIAFYQKCGFRMDNIRRDYFAYIQPPISEDGIPLRDMIVFKRTV